MISSVRRHTCYKLCTPKLSHCSAPLARLCRSIVCLRTCNLESACYLIKHFSTFEHADPLTSIKEPLLTSIRVFPENHWTIFCVNFLICIQILKGVRLVLPNLHGCYFWQDYHLLYTVDNRKYISWKSIRTGFHFFRRLVVKLSCIFKFFRCAQDILPWGSHKWNFKSDNIS